MAGMIGMSLDARGGLLRGPVPGQRSGAGGRRPRRLGPSASVFRLRRGAGL